MNQGAAGGPRARGLPEGFVYLDGLIEDCIIDAKYAGTDNFMGRPADGYEQPLVVASREVAEGCVKAADILREQGYLLKVFDAYRPQRAVDDFCRWGEDMATEVVDANHFRVSVDVAPTPPFFSWVFTFGGAIRIEGPAEVLEKMRDMATWLHT